MGVDYFLIAGVSRGYKFAKLLIERRPFRRSTVIGAGIARTPDFEDPDPFICMFRDMTRKAPERLQGGRDAQSKQ